MTRAIGSPTIHGVPPATPSRPARQTKPMEEAGFAHQLLTLLQPRGATPTTPTARKPATTAPASEIEKPDENEKGADAVGARARVGPTPCVARDATPPAKSTDDAHAAPTTAPSPTPHAATSANAQPSATPRTPTASAVHAGSNPTDGSFAVDGTIAALAGWITMRAELDTHETTPDAGHTASSQTKTSQSTSPQATDGSDRSSNVLAAMNRPGDDTHAAEPVKETAHAASDSSSSDTREMEPSPAPSPGANNSVAASVSPQTKEALPPRPDVTVVALSTGATDAAATPGAKDHSASASTGDSTIDSAAAAALTTAATTSDAPASQSSTSASDGAAQTPGPDVTSALAANTIAPAPADRITVQLPTDQGPARIQIAVSNGTVVTRIMMPDATSAAHLAAASGELHDALARQGFDAVKIAIPAPPGSGPSPLAHSADRSPDATPDRAPQQSFTSAQDHKASGRPQQRPRRQRER